jgi:hypothetical protein
VSEPKWTPGSWRYQEKSDAYTHIVRADETRFICQLSQDRSGEVEANARLIASAPELYEAVRKAEQLASIADDWHLPEVEIDGEMTRTMALANEFKALLAKARGETKP